LKRIPHKEKTPTPVGEACLIVSLFSGSTVLLVDDSDDIRLMLKQMLLMNNYRVIEASNGQEAIEIVHERCPDLILVDLNMPRLDGLSLVEKVRALKGKCEGVPIIAMTAFHTYGMKEAAIQAGCNEYITKPIEMEKLEKLLSGYLQYVVVSQNSAS
jgi:two-component system cell cycle response regulator DivK